MIPVEANHRRCRKRQGHFKCLAWTVLISSRGAVPPSYLGSRNKRVRQSSILAHKEIHAPIGVAMSIRSRSKPDQNRVMPPIVFTCPTTRMRLQEFLPDDDKALARECDGVFRGACSRVHFVNHKGEVLGVENED